VSVEASTVGDFARGFSWQLRVDESGAAELTIQAFPKDLRRRFVVPAQELTALRQAVERERFFLLADEYGQQVVDSSTTVIRVTLGGREKTVTLRYLMNWVHSSPERLREPARALRVLQLVRGWFDDPDAVDLRRYDEMVLRAAQHLSGPRVSSRDTTVDRPRRGR